MSTPLAVVTAILDFVEDPVEPTTKTVATWSHRFLFFGSNPPLEQQGSISFLNSLSKTQIKSAINAQIIAAAAALGVSIDAQRIITISDLAG